MRIETERKYLVTRDDAFPNEDAMTRAFTATPFTITPKGTIVHKDRYYDDARLSLTRAGFALRRRMGEGRVTAALKTLGTVQGGLHVRGELEAEFETDASSWDAWPESIAQHVRTVCDPRSVNALMELEVERTLYGVQQDGTTVATLSFDAVVAKRPRSDARTAWREVEIEAAGDTASDEANDTLAAIGTTVETLLPLEPTLDTKLQRAQAAWLPGQDA